MSSMPFSIYDFFAYLSSGFVVLVAVDHSFYDGRWADASISAPQGVLAIIAAYVIGQLVAQLASYLLETKLLFKRLMVPDEVLFGAAPRGWPARVFAAYYRPLPPEIQDRVIARASAEAGIAKPGRALFLHCWAHARGDELTFNRLSAFLNQYGFARNMATAGVVAAALVIAGAVTGRSEGSVGENGLIALGSLLASLGMLYRYLKFFRLYTKEVFVEYAANRGAKSRSPSSAVPSPPAAPSPPSPPPP